MSLLTVIIIIVVILAITGSGKQSPSPQKKEKDPDDPWQREKPVEAGDDSCEEHHYDDHDGE